MPLTIFKKLASIPRPSGKEEKVVEFIKQFAKENNIIFETDQHNNVVLKKKTLDAPAIALQAHTDMVCVAEKGNEIDFEIEGIEVFETDGFLHANKTSLGADNGIGVAMALKILTEDFPMNVEVVLTSEEETTMAGAFNFDASILSAKYMLSLDGSSNNKIDISSASSSEFVIKLPEVKKLTIAQIQQSFASRALNAFSISVSGLIGGHSGVDIGKNRGSAIKVALEFFEKLKMFFLVSVDAKSKANEIPRNFSAVFVTEKSLEEVNQIAKKLFEEAYLSIHAPALSINVKRVNLAQDAVAILDTDLVVEFLNKIKFGALQQNSNMEIVLSANLFEIDLEKNQVGYSLRANHEQLREFQVQKLKSLCFAYGAELIEKKHLPSFSVDENNKFVKYVQKASMAVFKENAEIVNIHAGLEAGIFASKIEGLSVCVIGPEISFMHSAKEQVNIESVNKTYEWLKLIVKNFK